MKRLISGLLISAIFVLSLAGCGGGGGDVVYQAEYLGFDSQYRELSGLSIRGDSIFLLAQELVQNGESLSVVVELDAKGKKRGSFQYISQQFELGEGRKGQSAVEAIAADASGNLWLLESMYSLEVSEEGEQSEPRLDYALTKTDGKGKVLLSIDINGLFEDKDPFALKKTICLDNNGNLYLLLRDGGYGTLTVYSGKGEPLFSPMAQIGAVAVTENGEVAVSVKPEGDAAGPSLHILDLKDGSLGPGLEQEVGFSYLYSGEASCLYLNDSRAVYRFDIAGGITEKLFDWMDSDLMNGAVQYFGALSNGSFALIGTGIYGTERDLILLRPVPASSVTEKISLSVATIMADYKLKEAAARFNRESPDYKIKITELDDGNQTDPSVVDKFYVELMADKVPDIIDLSQFDAPRLISAGLMEDLSPYLEADPELNAGDFMPNLLESIEVEGELFYLPVSVYLRVLAGSREVVGEKDAWTMERLIKTAEENPQYKYILGTAWGRVDFLRLALEFNMERYVDFYSRKCDFENQDFYELLAFAKEYFPAESEPGAKYRSGKEFDSIMNGEQMLYCGNVINANELQLINALFGGRAVFAGFPCDTGGENILIPNMSLGIAQASSHKDAAWAFMRTLYLEDSYVVERSESFPTNIKALNKVLEHGAKKRVEISPEGEEIELPRVYVNFSDRANQSVNIDLYALTQEEVELARELLLETDRLDLSRNTTANSIKNIISEEADAYFHNDKTAKEVAATIQERARIFLAE